MPSGNGTAGSTVIVRTDRGTAGNGSVASSPGVLPVNVPSNGTAD